MASFYSDDVKVHLNLKRGSRFVANLDEAFRQARAYGMDDATRAADEMFRRNEKELFSTEGASGTKEWTALSPEYKERKDRLFGKGISAIKSIAKARGVRVTKRGIASRLGAENKILQLSGEMKDRFTRPGGHHIARWRESGRKLFIELGAESEIASYHIKGSPKLPVRNPMAMTSEQLSKFAAPIGKAMIPQIIRAVRLQALTRG